MAPKVAFITGGNGITGSAIIEHLARNTTKEEWSDIIVTSRSPFKTLVEDPRIKFVALDYTKDPKELIESSREICAPVTHAYFSSYVHKDDFAELNTANQALFENFLKALVEVTPKLESVCLQTGGKYYNVGFFNHLTTTERSTWTDTLQVHLKPVSSPAREEDPRLVPFDQNFYYPQEDFLAEMQKGQKWTWNVIRPEAIIGMWQLRRRDRRIGMLTTRSAGHTSKPNGMNSALTYALYFLVQKELGQPAPMPTNQVYWYGVDDCSDAAMIADLTVWATTNPKAANQAFNSVNGDHIQWRYMWPNLAKYLGLEATSEQEFKKPAPEHGGLQQEFSLIEWSQDKRPVWDKICDQAGLPEAKATWDAGTWQYQD
jgi:nucleoside-diphosphate-sugar epimerase